MKERFVGLIEDKRQRRAFLQWCIPVCSHTMHVAKNVDKNGSTAVYWTANVSMFVMAAQTPGIVNFSSVLEHPSVGALLKFGIMVRASAMLISLYDRVLGMFSSRQTNGISWQLFLCLLKIITLPGNSLHAKNILSCQNVFSRVGRWNISDHFDHNEINGSHGCKFRA